MSISRARLFGATMTMNFFFCSFITHNATTTATRRPRNARGCEKKGQVIYLERKRVNLLYIRQMWECWVVVKHRCRRLHRHRCRFARKFLEGIIKLPFKYLKTHLSPRMKKNRLRDVTWRWMYVWNSHNVINKIYGFWVKQHHKKAVLIKAQRDRKNKVPPSLPPCGVSFRVGIKFYAPIAVMVLA